LFMVLNDKESCQCLYCVFHCAASEYQIPLFEKDGEVKTVNRFSACNKIYKGRPK
jgi:hypothetical protein